ncbi:DNA-binding transcriptional MerR regulator [Sporomusaceae bacterium BoRhaA]|uniref:MerR family transcriptional regulator n=1 Tax=Pelorhabdus rhamnosifermentans TaxID=2772457 RepID=UPI001C0648E6|nr:MerR family transcriptional regulator [Pelorhabdus rhamnosifermentans]MBU2700097.1 DNA-binding transcriptional MerR regulator [Pelorhabdus rhamnosifermentans]
MNYSIGQFSTITNVSSPTLRYYEKEQLLIVSRDSAGRRFYTEEDIAWILFIKRLKDTGMSINNIREYALLRYQGDSTTQQRLEILEKHRLAVIEEKAKWETNLLNLDEKIKIYKSKLSQRPETSP